MRRTHIHSSATRLVATSTALGALVLAGAGSTAAHAAEPYAYSTTLTFDKNPSDPSNSRLYWRVFRTYESGRQVKVREVSWRAGSGLGVKNECTKNRGWLPNGYYDVTLYMQYNGSAIKGVVFKLSDKKCAAGTATRTELFIHSEMTRTGGQGGIESQRWTDRNPNDYLSQGCIKLNPTDVKALAAQYQQYHRAGTAVRGKLAVVS
ncbi:hypothetical protein ACFU5O_18450 [Streptomyces sp. NPDC057445]|uniref:hypothetical protein n=1 Tax=Streptomyces sp. NPDC057445 TaxID=3346136 RepID=UPI0036C3B4C7